MTDETERRLLDLINAYAAATRGPDDPFGERAACLNEVAAQLSAAIHSTACRIGGDPPVPGVGWGVMTTANHGGWRIVWAVRRVTFTEVGWSVGLDGEGGKGVAANEIEALYLPGAPAGRPCWRRHE